MNIQDRIVRHEKTSVEDILFNPQNWRMHPKHQQDTLDEVLTEVGWVQSVIINQQTGHLIDGHLRVQLAAQAGETTIPAVIVDLTPEEEKIILASFDPIGQMAITDEEKLNELIQEIGSENENLKNLLEHLSGSNDVDTDSDGESLSLLNLSIQEPISQVEQGNVFYLNEHILICASPIKDTALWSGYLDSTMMFAPYANPLTLLSEQAKSQPLLLVNPEPFICGHILDRWIEIYGDDNVIQR